MEKIKKKIKKMSSENYVFHCIMYFLLYRGRYYIYGKKADEVITKKRYRKIFGKKLDLDNPVTLNEKIHWLKLNLMSDFYTQCADKLAVRDYWKQFGKEGLIPLLYKTYDYKDITFENLPDEPCIVKCNSGSAAYEIVKDKSSVDYRRLRKKCRIWLHYNYYYKGQEKPYMEIKPCIIVEKLLLDADGHIPNDYKLHYINGELQFIYCSIDREGENYRSIYDPEWNRLNMEWVAPVDHKDYVGADIPKPATFEQMERIADEIAKDFAYVRVDFYDVEGNLYYGEITLYHGSGYDTFEPSKYDTIYGKKLKLPFKNEKFFR